MKNEKLKEYTEDKVSKSGRKYTNNYVQFKCAKCSSVTSILSKYYTDSRLCDSCSRLKLAEDRFFAKSEERYGSAYDLSNTTYTGPKEHLTVVCTKHNEEVVIKPVDFMHKKSKGGCKTCAKEAHRAAITRPIEHYLLALNTRFPQFSVVSHGTAESNTEKIELLCEYHGKFTKTLHSLTSKESVHLCPGCNNDLNAWKMRTTREDIPGRVYFVYIPEISMFKFGVTARTTRQRMQEIKHKTEIIWEIEFQTLSDAYFFEYQFFRENKKLRYTGERVLNSGGYTELFISFINKPKKSFIEEILCRKESKRGTPEH